MIEALILKYGYDKVKKLCRLAALGFGVVASIVAFGWNQQSKGAAKVVVNINAQAKEIAKGGVEARKPAMRNGAAERLRADSCRDC
jgi:hypothetical protein